MRLRLPSTPDGDARLLRTVRWRLVAWSGGITLVILLVLGVAAYGTTAWSLDSRGTDALEQRAVRVLDALTRGVVPRAGAPDQGQGPVGFAFGGETSGTFSVIVAPGGSVVGPSFSDDATLASVGLPVQAGVTAAQGGTVDVRSADVAGTPVRVLSAPVSIGGQTYVVQIIGDRTADVRTLQTLFAVLLAGGLGALALAIAGGAFYAHRALVPIRESLRRQREFAADASHELRTPLAIVRGSVEHLQRHPDESVASVGTALDDIGAEVDHLTDLVDSLLLLARADSGAIELERLPVDLADVATGALAALSTLATERRVRLALDAEPAQMVGDPVRLRQLVMILADNAIRHSPDGGTVTVSVRLAHEARGRDRRPIGLTVDDQGQGIAAEHREHVFDRFWRAPGAPAGGTGLGLSIAAWIVERHGGEIVAEEAPGGGARFRASLPEAPIATEPRVEEPPAVQ